MKNENGVLEFKKYYIEKLEYSFNPNYFAINNTVDIKPEFKRDIENLQDGGFALHLLFEIKSSETSPIAMHIDMVGVFNIKTNIENDIKMAHSKASAILFPYLRSAITQITMQVGIPPLVIPIINIEKLFEEEKS